MKIAVADDHLAVDWLIGLAGQPIVDDSQPGILSASLEAAQAMDQQLFSRACSTIENRASGIELVSASIRPERKNNPLVHFSDEFLGWKGLVTSLHLSSCELLVGP